MKNRRNYYRVLHVQPEAPLEIIKASYRGLMIKLKAHPDLGGDHDAAVLINQAYAVLSNADKRRRYDLDRQGLSATGPSHQAAQRRSASAVATRAYQRHSGTGLSVHAVCLFCTSDIVAAVPSRCTFCGSPLHLSTVPSGRRQMEVFGRRAAPRIAKTGSLMVYPSWPHPGHRAQLRDLSLSGISLFCDFAPHHNQILKLDSLLLAAVMQVASVRSCGGRYRIHGPLLVAEFATQTGGFVSTRV